MTTKKDDDWEWHPKKTKKKRKRKKRKMDQEHDQHEGNIVKFNPTHARKSNQTVKCQNCTIERASWINSRNICK